MTGVLDNARKQPLAYRLNRFSSTQAGDTVELLGKVLPSSISSVSGQIATVGFEIDAGVALPGGVQMPVAHSLYDWVPYQPGDKGLPIAADVYLGGISGLGGGTADMTQRANLSSLLFLPVSNTAWQPPGGDPNKRVIQGPSGARMQDMAGKTVIVVDGSNITITVPAGSKVTVSSGGTAQPVKLADGSNSLVLMAE